MNLTESKFLISDYAKHQRTTLVTPLRLKARPKEEIAQILGPSGLEFGPSEYKLGTLQELFARQQDCPFCKLAVSSLKEQFAFAQHGEDGPTEKQFYSANISCFVSWQIDGRILVYDKDNRVAGSKPCTRRIRLRWQGSDPSGTSLLDTYIVLMAPRTGGLGLFLGRSIDTTKIDAALIQRWIRLCDEFHGHLCKPQNPTFSLGKAFFGVVDVKEMCLTKLPKDGRYIALSYLWGNDSRPFLTTKSKLKVLLESGGIRRWQHELPRTIRDAINLVIDLGERYLWVDRLCIIQDSKRSWALNSRVMDIVYGNAYLTICAADGENANAGLKGLYGSKVHGANNIAQYSRDLRLLSTQPAENYIKHSKWNTRGWTFQERLLSPRNVIFASGRVFFQCRCCARSIDIITEHETAGWSIEFKDSPMLMVNKLTTHPLTVYKKSLELYMTRKLSRPTDILAAFTGIGNLVCDSLGGDLIWGLPSSHFDWALLWEPRDAAARRPKEEGAEQFPSWSWCGWKGEIMEYKEPMVGGCEDNLHDWLMHHTWITWYVRDRNGNLRLVWGAASTKAPSSQVEARWRGYTNGSKDDAAYDQYGRFIRNDQRDKPRSDGFHLILDECPYDVNIVESIEAMTINSTETDMPYLQFFTWRAFFRIQEDLRPPRSSFGEKFQRYNILDYKDDFCGTILLDKFWVKIRNLENPMEFVAISDAKQFSEDEYDDWAYYNATDRQESDWDLFFVLMIERKDDISYRVGLGKVFKEAFHNSCRPEGKEWKEFILG